MLNRKCTEWMDAKLNEGLIHSLLCCHASSSQTASSALTSHQEPQDDGDSVAVGTVSLLTIRDGDSAKPGSRN